MNGVCRTGAALLVLALSVPGCGGSKAASASAPPPSVSVIVATPETIGVPSEWIATLDGYVNAQIRPQVTGYLIKRTYQEGGVVKKGDVLFEIDPRPFEVALSQTQAQVGQAEAQLGKAQRDLERDKPLAEQRAIAQSQLDNDVQASLAAEATLKSAQAAVDAAQLNLGFTKVTSLIGGIAAIATAQIGDLVGPATLLTTVSQTDPIKAYFPLSEQEYIRIADRLNHTGTGGQPFKQDGLQLILADGSNYPHMGRFDAADRQIDQKTGTIRISAAFPNPGNTLRPGQYGRVRAETATLSGALLVPQRAVAELQGAYQLRVVDADNHVSTRAVKLGDRLGTRWIVTQGINPGDRVVVEGAQVNDGTVVTPRPFGEEAK